MNWQRFEMPGKKKPGVIINRICLIPLFVGVAAGLASCGGREGEQKGEARTAKTMVLRPAAGGFVKTYPGTVEASERVNLSFDVSGPLVELPVKEGDLVKKGQLLGQIRKRDFEIAVRGAESRLEEARATLEKMKAGAREEDIRRLEAKVASAKSAAATAEAEFQRMEKSFEAGAAAKSEVDRARRDRDRTASALKQAEEELAIGRSGARAEDIKAMEANINSLNAQLDRAKADLDDTTLLAPFSGRIAKTFVDQFENVQAKGPVLSIVSEIEVLVNVPEEDVITRNSASRAEFTVAFRDGQGSRFVYPAELKKWSPEADPDTGTFPVTLAIATPEEIRVFPGMSATVRAELKPTTRPAEAKFVVPLSAVFSEARGESSVWVLDPSTMAAGKRNVKVGAQSDGRIEIVEGLQAGEEIVTAGVHYIREGMKLRRSEKKGSYER